MGEITVKHFTNYMLGKYGTLMFSPRKTYAATMP